VRGMWESWSSGLTWVYFGPAGGCTTPTPGPLLHAFSSFSFFAYEETIYAAP
jgi:hypothetical protein